MQVLEGGRTAVNLLYNDFVRDERHKNVVILHSRRSPSASSPAGRWAGELAKVNPSTLLKYAETTRSTRTRCRAWRRWRSWRSSSRRADRRPLVRRSAPARFAPAPSGVAPHGPAPPSRFARREDLGSPGRSSPRSSGSTRRRRSRPPEPHSRQPRGERRDVALAREVLRQRRAHCLEGAIVAACALWVTAGRRSSSITTATRPTTRTASRSSGAGGAGARSRRRTGRAALPRSGYRSLRELALSYFHEYCDRKGRHTLRSYSGAFDLRRVDTDLWVTPQKACWDVHERLVGLRHYPLVSVRQVSALSRRDPFESRVARLLQYPKLRGPP